MPEKSVPRQTCECLECNCSNPYQEQVDLKKVCYECTLGLHSPRPEIGTPEYRHNEIDKAYSDTILPMVCEKEIKECYSQHAVAHFFREMLKHWYDLGIMDERAKHAKKTETG